MSSAALLLAGATLLFGEADAALRAKLKESTNLCMHGRVAPEFFLLGAQKSATTSLSADLLHNKRIAFSENDHSGRMGRLELHFFDIADRYANGTEFMVSHYPRCPEERLVGIDATPQIHMKNTLQRIATTYAGLTGHLKFTLILREPTARTHSAYHHAVWDGWGELRKLMPTFKEYADYILSEQGAKDIETQRGQTWVFRNSNYVDQLKTFLTLFKPGQLMVAPMQLYVHHPTGVPPLAQEISEWLGVPLSDDYFSSGLTIKRNAGFHRTLQQELTPKEIAAFTERLYNYTGPELVAAQLDGVRLYGFQGSGQATLARRTAWLREGW